MLYFNLLHSRAILADHDFAMFIKIYYAIEPCKPRIYLVKLYLRAGRYARMIDPIRYHDFTLYNYLFNNSISTMRSKRPIAMVVTLLRDFLCIVPGGKQTPSFYPNK